VKGVLVTIIIMRAVAGGGLVTTPSPRSECRFRPRERRRSSSSPERGGEGEVIDRVAESESSATSSMHPSLRRPYTPSLPHDSSDADTDADVDSLQKDLLLRCLGQIRPSLIHWLVRSS
jgi:hypothetical protein